MESRPLAAIPRRFVLRVCHGDIVGTPGECVAVNHYSGLQISGAEAALDRLLAGLLTAMAARGSFDYEPGHITFVPTPRAHMAADTVVVLSMGEYEHFVPHNLDLVGAEQFVADQLRLFGRSLAVACCEVGLRDVVSVAHGAGRSSRIDPETVTRYLVEGYWQGLRQRASPGQTHMLTLVERDTAKIQGLCNGAAAAMRLLTHSDPAASQPAAPVTDPAAPSAAASPPTPLDSVWAADLDAARTLQSSAMPAHLRLGALLAPGAKLKLSTIGTGSADQVVFDQYPGELIQEIQDTLRKLHDDLGRELAGLEQALAAPQPQKRTEARYHIAALHQQAETQMLAFGRLLYNQVLNPSIAAEIRTQLARQAARILLLRLDENTATIPWELMADKEGLLGLTREIGRQLELVGTVRRADYLRTGPEVKGLRVLLVANPTGDLPNAEDEANRIAQRLSLRQDLPVHITPLYGRQATRVMALTLLNEGYDVFHYAGHAFFDDQRSGESGLVLSDGIVTADQLWSVTEAPRLVFFNACETAATRAVAEIVEKPYVNQLRLGAISALLRAGVSNFVGALWPVQDMVATEIAVACYADLAMGHTIGDSLRQARLTSIQKLGYGHLSWASYVLYGNPWNRLVNG